MKTYIKAWYRDDITSYQEMHTLERAFWQTEQERKEYLYNVK